MISDVIFDRQMGFAYDPVYIQRYCIDYVNKAFATGDNREIQKALCVYMISNDYSPAMCNYIYHNDWTTAQPESAFIKYTILVRAAESRDMSELVGRGLPDTATTSHIFDMFCNSWRRETEIESREQLLEDFAKILESI